MRSTLKLGRLGGVPIGAHWSVLLTVALVVSILGAQVLPSDAPNDSVAIRWIVAAVASFLFFASLLAHEFMHAVYARKRGLGVQGITLWLLGGVTQMDSDPKTPKDDLQVAAAGPIASFIAGAVFVGAAQLSHALNAPDSLAVGFAWVGFTNLIIAVFNVLPGAPLDGGRLLRALVWMRTGSRARGAAVATTAGRGLGAGLIAVGLVLTVAQSTIGGLWLALLGWFLIQASGAENRSERMVSALEGIRVRDVMRTGLATVPSWFTPAVFLDRIAATSQQNLFPVVGLDGHPVGLITLGRLTMVPKSEMDRAKIEQLCMPLHKLTTAAPDDMLTTVMTGKLRPGQPVVVIHNGQFVGLIESQDLARITQLAALGKQRDGITPPDHDNQGSAPLPRQGSHDQHQQGKSSPQWPQWPPRNGPD